MNPISKLLRREDFRNNPMRAVARRLYWRVRWAVNSRPWIHELPSGHRLLTPRIGTGAQIYYQGCSEPEMLEFVGRYLTRGMTVIDVGAHVGEYTVLTAGAVGPEGRVHAFEPNHEMSILMERSLRLNRLSNVVMNEVAVAGRAGDRTFEIRNEPAVSALRPDSVAGPPHRVAIERVIVVPTTTLDGYCSMYPGPVHLVKIDVEGAELEVFQGAESLLRRKAGSAPVWLFEISSENCPRFGYQPEDLIEYLTERGYTVMRYRTGGRLEPFDASGGVSGTFNLVACRDAESVVRRIAPPPQRGSPRNEPARSAEFRRPPAGDRQSRDGQ